MNSSRSKLITGCWIATHPIEIYCNVGNPQLFYTSCTGVEVFCWAASILQGGDLNRYFNNFHYYFRIHLIRSNISCVRSLFTVMLLYKVRQNALFCCIYFINKYRIDVCCQLLLTITCNVSRSISWTCALRYIITAYCTYHSLDKHNF